ncbi:MAG: carbonic anhydrase/acetyltransferase [Acidobacteria bacterium OLB17]|nr:MAG: carbonic anhydrase/acetyltransferase [Acidobacteria bacterium OLB17]MCZ2390149.1 gamma carbonic anhydrase family protein [Acidobacteriota bacterium]
MIRRFENNEPRIHASAFIAENAEVIGDVEIGEDSSIWFGTVVRGDVNHIRIGARTNIQDNSVIHVTGGTHPTILGDEITAGHRVLLHGCTVENRCLIGMGAILMDGVHVGEECLIGAGSLLTPGTIVPPRSMILGSPARVKRELTEDEIAFLDRSWRNYTELKLRY